MLKQRPLIPAGWARTALRCGVVALGAGLVSAAAAVSAQAAAPAHGTITGNGVNVRNAPSLNGTVVGSKNRGDRVAMYCSHRDSADRLWDEIQVSAPQWVAAEYVRVDSGAVPACDGLGDAATGAAGQDVHAAGSVRPDTGADVVGPMIPAENTDRPGASAGTVATSGTAPTSG